MEANEEKTSQLEKTLTSLEKRLEDQDIQGRSKSLVIHGLNEEPSVETELENSNTYGSGSSEDSTTGEYDTDYHQNLL